MSHPTENEHQDVGMTMLKSRLLAVEQDLLKRGDNTEKFKQLQAWQAKYEQALQLLAKNHRSQHDSDAKRIDQLEMALANAHLRLQRNNQAVIDQNARITKLQKDRDTEATTLRAYIKDLVAYNKARCDDFLALKQEYAVRIECLEMALLRYGIDVPIASGDSPTRQTNATINRRPVPGSSPQLGDSERQTTTTTSQPTAPVGVTSKVMRETTSAPLDHPAAKPTTPSPDTPLSRSSTDEDQHSSCSTKPLPNLPNKKGSILRRPLSHLQQLLRPSASGPSFPKTTMDTLRARLSRGHRNCKASDEPRSSSMLNLFNRSSTPAPAQTTLGQEAMYTIPRKAVSTGNVLGGLNRGGTGNPSATPTAVVGTANNVAAFTRPHGTPQPSQPREGHLNRPMAASPAAREQQKQETTAAGVSCSRPKNVGLHAHASKPSAGSAEHDAWAPELLEKLESV